MATKSKKQEDIQTLDAVDEAATEATEESKVENSGDTGESENGNTEAATSVDGNTITLDDDGDIKPLAADDYVENFEISGKTYAVRDVEAQDSITQLNSELSPLFVPLRFYADVTVAANSDVQTDLSGEIPDGYILFTIGSFYTTNANLYFTFLRCNWAAGGTVNAIVHNTSSSSQSSTLSVYGVCIRKGYMSY